MSGFHYIFLITFLFFTLSERSLSQDSLAFSRMDVDDDFTAVASWMNRYHDLEEFFIKNNNQVDKLPSPGLLIMYISWNWQLYPLFIKPNQIIEIYQDENQKYHYSTENTPEVLLLKELMDKQNLSFLKGLTITWSYKVDYRKIPGFFEKDYKESLKIVKSYKDKYGLDQNFEAYLLNELKAIFVSNLLTPSANTNPTANINLDSIAPKYVKKILSFKPFVQDLSQNQSKSPMRFGAPLPLVFNRFLCRKSLGTPDEFQAQWDTASTFFKDKTQEFLKFLLLKHYQSERIPNYQVYLEEFRNYSQDQDYIHYLDSLYRINNHRFDEAQLESSVLSLAGDSLVWQDILSKNQGKVIYLDFWASWCGPCRKEMEYYPQLLESTSALTVNKDKLAFVFVSVDWESEKWQDAIVQLNTDQAHFQHYLLKDQSPIWHFFKLNSVPHYAIIDPKGRLIAYDATRPGNLKTLFLIQELLQAR